MYSPLEHNPPPKSPDEDIRKIEREQDLKSWLAHPQSKRILAALDEHVKLLTSDAKKQAASSLCEERKLRLLLVEANQVEEIISYVQQSHIQNSVRPR